MTTLRTTMKMAIGRRGPSMHASRGVTLIELFIGVAVLAVLVAAAAPSLTRVLLDNRIRSQSSDLLANLAVARSESAKRGVRVTVCASTTFANASPSCDGAGSASAWSNGYILFTDPNDNKAFDAGEVVLKVAEPLAGGNTLASSGFPTTAPLGADRFQFRPSGNTSLAAAGGSFKLCDNPAHAATPAIVGRQITISVTGRASSNPVACP